MDHKKELKSFLKDYKRYRGYQKRVEKLMTSGTKKPKAGNTEKMTALLANTKGLRDDLDKLADQLEADIKTEGK